MRRGAARLASSRRDVGAEAAGQVRHGERVGLRAVGEEAVAADGEEAEAVQEPVGGLDGSGVGGELRSGDVADDRDVRSGGGERGGAGEGGEGPGVPRATQHR